MIFIIWVFIFIISMQSQFLAAIQQLCDEKNIPREVVMETIKAALRAAYRKDYGNREQNIEVNLDEKSGKATVLLVKEVVKKRTDADLQMSLKEAQKIKPDAKVGDYIKLDVTPIDYGRIAAQSAKQVIIQRLQEAEREMMYDLFKNRENELLNALVHRVENSNVYVNLEDKATTILPPNEQIPGERYYGGQRVKIYLDKVIKTTKGPQLLISRTHPNLVRKLLELEIPEVRNGSVEIKGVAREPGMRCKVAVMSTDPKIDPIGSCVGQKGVRVQNIMDELNGERIDIIQWSDNEENFLRTALSPAKVTAVKLDKEKRRAAVYVTQDQRPLSIGRNGQNVRLASQLTGWEVDILDADKLGPAETGAPSAGQSGTGGDGATTSTAPLSIKDLANVPASVVTKLAAVNLTLVSQLHGLTAKDFMAIEGISKEEADATVAAIKAGLTKIAEAPVNEASPAEKTVKPAKTEKSEKKLA